MCHRRGVGAAVRAKGDGMTSVRSLAARVTKLEERTSSAVVVVWKHHTETDEAAKDRWKRENPGQDPDAAGLRVILIRWADPA